MKYISYICETIKPQPHMKTTQNKTSTKLLKTFLKRKGLTTIKSTFSSFGEVSVRIVSVSESDKYNWNDQKYGNVINVEITAKKTGFRCSEDRIPSNSRFNFRGSRQSFFKTRKYFATNEVNNLLRTTELPTFLKLASITTPNRQDELIGNITYKFID